MKPPLSLLRLALRNPNLRISPWIRPLSSAAAPQPSDRVVSIVDDISNLTLLEVADLTNLLRQRLNVDQMPMLAVISPGMSFAGGGAAGPAAAAAAEEKKEEKEKTAFDVKLEGFDAAAKIKVIKEVRGFTELGLKEAKELVEKVPVVVKSGVSKEEAEKIVEKLKGVGAKVALE